MTVLFIDYFKSGRYYRVSALRNERKKWHSINWTLELEEQVYYIFWRPMFVIYSNIILGGGRDLKKKTTKDFVKLNDNVMRK